MFGLGMSELLVLGILALILIGPKQLPEVARTLGRFINDLKRSAEGLSDEIKRQAKVDLDLDLKVDKDFLEPRKKARDPDAPIPIMKDPRLKNIPDQTIVEDKKDIVIQAPDQMTFTFDPARSNDVNPTEAIVPEAEPDKSDKPDSGKKE